MTTLLRRAAAVSVSLSILLTAPGSAAYAAVASIVDMSAVSPAGPRVGALPVLGASALTGTSVMTLTTMQAPALRAFAAPSAVVAPSIAAPAVAPALAVRPAASLPARAVGPLPAASPAPALSPNAVALPAPSVETGFEAARRQTAAALESVGDLAAAAPSGLHDLGVRLEAALTGAPALSATDGSLPAASIRFDDPSDRGGHLARPAGDSIRQAAEALETHPAPSMAPPAPPAGRAPAPAPAPQGPRAPFWPKLLAAGLALVPAYFLGLPLLAAGSVLLGGLTVASAVGLAVMPFLSESAPRVLRAAPGALLLGAGAAAILAGFAWPGAFALVGGWGLVRYGLGKSSVPRYESLESLSAYFGGIAALTGAALAASHPAGWLALGVRDAAYPLAALLWLHLPSWVGEGMSAAFEGAWLGTKGLSRVLTAVHRDTNLLERLKAFSERHWTASKWNGVWLAVVWTPVVLVEFFKRALAVVAGLYVGAVQAPVNFLWGASYKLLGAGKTSAYFAEASRFVFDRLQNGKASFFNKAEAKVLPWANAASFPKRAAGSLGLTALQLGWVVYAAVGAPLLSLAGLVVAFGRMGNFDAARHAPSSLRVNSEDSPGAVPTEPSQPTEPTTPAKAPFAPKLLAAALALLPAWYFGVPLFTGTLYHGLGILYAFLVLPLAAMPFMGPRTPVFIKSLAARGLSYNGLLLFFSGHALIAGALTTLGGWGFSRWVAAASDDKARRFDDGEELGAYFGALGSAVAVGAAWVGLTGLWGEVALALGLATSPFLLMHLPEWVDKGVLGALRGVGDSAGSYEHALGYWRDDAKFMANLRRHADFWLKKTFWNGVWLSVIWVPTGVIAAAEYALAVVLGVATGLARLPLTFAAAATKSAKRAGRPAIFFNAALDGWRSASEGSKALFDHVAGLLKPALDEASPVSGRPTAKAALALLGLRFVQAAWLIGTVAMNFTGFGLLWGLYRGARAAFAPTQDYRVYLPGIRIDAPLNGANAREVTDTYWNSHLDPFFKDLAADFERAGVPYDKEKFTPAQQVDGHGVTLAGDGSDKQSVTMWIVLKLDARQAAVVRERATKLEPAPRAFLASGR
jgi:hypothetical protein